MNRLAIFASGNGSNAENIIRYFQADKTAQVSWVGSNRTSAFVLERAARLGITGFSFTREELEGTEVLNRLKKDRIDFIILAGFLLKVPENIIHEYENRIINIHPALLPAYGGRGMYGDRVHQAVLENGEVRSGITIHLVNKEYDKGKIIFQAQCPVFPHDTVQSLAARIHELEYQNYPVVIQKYIQGD